MKSTLVAVAAPPMDAPTLAQRACCIKPTEFSFGQGIYRALGTIQSRREIVFFGLRQLAAAFIVARCPPSTGPKGCITE
jgi:hypothetical protein